MTVSQWGKKPLPYNETRRLTAMFTTTHYLTLFWVSQMFCAYFFIAECNSNFPLMLIPPQWPLYLYQIHTWLATGWTDRESNPGGGKIFRTCPDRPWGPPSLLYNGYRVFPPGIKSGRGVTLTPHPLLVPWSRKDRSIPVLPLSAVRPVQSLSACTKGAL